MSDTASERTKSRRPHSVLACEECRSRKLRCDMSQPQCGTCHDLGIVCVTNTARRPRGPKKGHVSALKSRIAFLERQLNSNSQPQETDAQPDVQENTTQAWEAAQSATVHLGEDNSDDDSPVTFQASLDVGDLEPVTIAQWPSMIAPMDLDGEWYKSMDTLSAASDPTYFSEPSSEANICVPALSYSPLDASTSPIQQDLKKATQTFLSDSPAVHMSDLERADLDDLFFERVYAFAPIINQSRYYAVVTQDSEASDVFKCLQYAMRTLAASMGSQFNHLRYALYHNTRYMLETLDRNVLDENVPIELVQAWLLLALYEILKANPQRGWISAGRCFRLIHLLKLHEIDNPESWQRSIWSNLSWVEMEERRRTFWAAYTLDRYASLLNHLPVTLNEQMILTRLPAPETAFRRQEPVETEFLALAIAKKGEQDLSLYAKSIIRVTLLARSVSHFNQCNVERIIERRSQDYLARHRALDDILSQEIQTPLWRVSVGPEPHDSTTLFIDMLAQATVLILFMALNSVPQGTNKCDDIHEIYEAKAAKAAQRIHNLTQNLSHLGCFKVHPFTPIVLFISAKFARLPNGLNNGSAALSNAMTTALYSLSPANNCARKFLQQLELE